MTREPYGHQVIAASAGSGKTHQLTNRYLCLLANGVEPDLILATTFTRKAAAEILDRVLARLARAASDAGEAKQLAAQIQAKKDTPRDFAAQLRRMLRSLHRVRIGTLDSFYIALARCFALEVGLPAGWTICEEADDEVLRQEALERLLEGEEADILTALYHRLTRGQSKRGVQQELLGIVDSLYRIHQETAANAWQKIAVPQELGPAELDDLLARIEAYNLSNHVRMNKPRAEDVARARSEQWKDMLAKGLMGKVFSGENAFYSKPIPGELIALYGNLTKHARSVLVQPLADQTIATRTFLDCFCAQLWKLKQATGALRFDEVTQTLVAAPQKNEMLPEAMAFRLDGAIEHLLLDEFQDTSLAQWRVLEPIAQRITRDQVDPPRSFFCVGDVKQAIYGWRGGMAEIFNALRDSLGPLQEDTLVESRRSAQPIIDVVNQVFGNLCLFQAGDKCQDGLTAWGDRFERHTTFRKADPGYVCLKTGPAQQVGQSIADHRGEHCKHVATRIRELGQQAPGRSIGVLCRKNDTVACMIYELRLLGVQASEEGGNPLTDSPAVQLALSLFTLADHPGHTVAWFHLKNSPLREHLESFADAGPLAKHLRRELLTKGYGEFTHGWAKRLAPACDRRDLGRLQQLVEIAYGYQPRSTLRADAFVTWVRQQRIPDPSGANVRVMSIHAAKGLEFDVVVLPELDAGLMGQPPAFVVHRDPKSLDVDFVCRYADEAVQMLLEENERRAFQQDRQQRAEESLSLLYVAMTRAVNALYLYIPGPREAKSVRKDAWYQLLMQTLAPKVAWTECALLFEHGEPNWFGRMTVSAALAVAPSPEPPAHIAFRISENARQRGLEHVAPSQREGRARVPLDRLFHPSEGTGTAAGTLYHVWFSMIGWLDDGTPTEDELRAAAEKMRAILPAETLGDLNRLLTNFRTWLQKSAISGVLRRSAYADPKQSAFPAALAPFWTRTIVPQKVEQERRFLVRDGAKFWNGSFDRIVWLGDGEHTVAADVLDFKTDAIPPEDAKALAARTAHYRPQLEAYRRAVAKLAQLPEERVATRLVFTEAARVVGI